MMAFSIRKKKKINTEFVESMGYSVYNGNIEDISFVDNVIVINTISPNSYGIATRDDLFKKALLKSDYLLLDGVYFGLASIFMRKIIIKKNQAPEVFKKFMSRINEEKGKVFFMGSNDDTLNKIYLKAKKDFPELSVGTYSPPYKDEFDEQENDKIINIINDYSPDILFVGMTCPKQEKWVYKNKDKIKVKIILSIGAVFDWYAGNEKEISSIWWRLNMAWLIRTINRPEILNRYPNIMIFFVHLFLAFIGIKKYRYEKI